MAGRSRSLVFLAAYAAIVGAVSFVLDVGPALSGQVPAMGRALLGLLGVAGGMLLWTGPRLGIRGWLVCMIWAVIQIPVFAWSLGGSPTAQIVRLPLSYSSKTTVNRVVTSYSEVGINVVGVILAVWLSRQRQALDRRDQTP